MNNPNSRHDSPVDAALGATQAMANEARDGINRAANGLRADLGPRIRQASEQAGDLAHRSADVMRNSARHLRHSAESATLRTRHYIEDEPVKAVLIAAAAGAVIVALLSLFTRSRSDS